MRPRFRWFWTLCLLVLAVPDPAASFRLAPAGRIISSRLLPDGEVPAAPKPPVEPWTIVALVAGCIFWLAPLALIASGIARRRIRRNGKRGEHLARAGFYLGLVGLFFLGLTLSVAFLLPYK